MKTVALRIGIHQRPVGLNKYMYTIATIKDLQDLKYTYKYLPIKYKIYGKNPTENKMLSALKEYENDLALDIPF